MIDEIWKPVKDFEGLYEVSNLGRVRSLDRIVKTSRGSRHFHSYVLSPAVSNKGYLLVLLCKDGKQHTKRVHRLVAEAFLPNIYNFSQINHLDGNKQNNCVDNLEWCDNSRNQIHAFQMQLNTPRKGELNGSHKLNENEVRSIRFKYSKGESEQQLGKEYGVSSTQIHRIVTNRNWVHVR